MSWKIKIILLEIAFQENAVVSKDDIGWELLWSPMLGDVKCKMIKGGPRCYKDVDSNGTWNMLNYLRIWIQLI